MVVHPATTSNHTLDQRRIVESSRTTGMRTDNARSVYPETGSGALRVAPFMERHIKKGIGIRGIK